MTLRTLVTFLFGSRAAIETIARSRGVLPLGLLFVLSAGLAREYDGEDLVHEPWHLLIPIAASLATSLVLYLLVRLFSVRRPELPPPSILIPESETFLTFLGFYWLTAPLAWVYAIPVERFLDASTAATVNLLLLAMVSAWRVIVITRVIHVVHPISPATALFVVLAFADTAMLIAILQLPFPIFVIMGGLRLSPADSVVQNAAELLCLLGFLSWPIWVIGAIIARPGAGSRTEEWMSPAIVGPSLAQRSWPRSGLWTLAVSAIVVGLIFLPFTQPAQMLRHKAEKAFARNGYPEVIELANAHEPEEFPPHWDPPPRVQGGEWEVKVDLDLLELLVDPPIKPWVRERMMLKASSGRLVGYLQSPKDRKRLLKVLETLPDGARILAWHDREIDDFLQYTWGIDAKDTTYNSDLERLKNLLVDAQTRFPDEINSPP